MVLVCSCALALDSTMDTGRVRVVNFKPRHNWEIRDHRKLTFPRLPTPPDPLDACNLIKFWFIFRYARQYSKSSHVLSGHRYISMDILLCDFLSDTKRDTFISVGIQTPRSATHNIVTFHGYSRTLPLGTTTILTQPFCSKFGKNHAVTPLRRTPQS